MLTKYAHYHESVVPKLQLMATSSVTKRNFLKLATFRPKYIRMYSVTVKLRNNVPNHVKGAESVNSFFRATLCVSAVFAVTRCLSVRPFVCHVGALYLYPRG